MAPSLDPTIYLNFQCTHEWSNVKFVQHRIYFIYPTGLLCHLAITIKHVHVAKCSHFISCLLDLLHLHLLVTYWARLSSPIYLLYYFWMCFCIQLQTQNALHCHICHSCALVFCPSLATFFSQSNSCHLTT